MEAPNVHSTVVLELQCSSEGRLTSSIEQMCGLMCFVSHNMVQLRDHAVNSSRPACSSVCITFLPFLSQNSGPSSKSWTPVKSL